MSRVSGFLRHLRAGTLVRRLIQGPRALPPQVRVRWYGADTMAEAVAALTHWGRQFVGRSADGWIVTLGEGGPLHERLDASLRAAGVPHRRHTLPEILAWDEVQIRGLKGIICAYTNVPELTAAARALPLHTVLASIPFEYAPGLHAEREIFQRRDEYAETHFIGPGLLDAPGPYRLYEESLALFEQKCGLRDYLDLYQLLKHVIDNRVPGDIAEFGSYKGHSGWLIARTLQALGSDKRLFMFDTFAEFPAESAGMDHFWSRTHQVDFGEVRRKLAPFPNVTLVRGDFTQTLSRSGLNDVALAYIDCDSYRATRFLIDALWNQHLQSHAAMVFEDYGHPALLGNRAAVHEELDHRKDAFRYFSQFSGYYVALKL